MTICTTLPKLPRSLTRPPPLLLPALCAAGFASMLVLPVTGAVAVWLTLMGALLPILPALRRIPAGVTYMVAGGMLGWMVGLRWDLGQAALFSLASWCLTAPTSPVEYLTAKLTLTPGTHIGMLAGCVAGMGVALHESGLLRRLPVCCAAMGVVMPVTVLTADAAFRNLAPQSPDLSVAIMAAIMCTLLAATAALLHPLTRGTAISSTRGAC